MDKDARIKLFEFFDHGEITQIAREEDISRQTIYNFRSNGKSNRVKKILIERYEKKKMAVETENKKISELIK